MTAADRRRERLHIAQTTGLWIRFGPAAAWSGRLPLLEANSSLDNTEGEGMSQRNNKNIS